jgi:hypothetical protein
LAYTNAGLQLEHCIREYASGTFEKQPFNIDRDKQRYGPTISTEAHFTSFLSLLLNLAKWKRVETQAATYAKNLQKSLLSTVL